MMWQLRNNRQKRPKKHDKKKERSKKYKKRKPIIFDDHHLIPKVRLSEIRRKILGIIRFEREFNVLSAMEWMLFRASRPNEHPLKALDRLLKQTKRGPRETHEYWNTLFNDGRKPLCPWEAILRIEKWSTKNKRYLLKNALSHQQTCAWKSFFGENVSPREAIKIIKNQWSGAFPPVSMMLDYISNKKGPFK